MSDRMLYQFSCARGVLVATVIPQRRLNTPTSAQFEKSDLVGTLLFLSRDVFDFITNFLAALSALGFRLLLLWLFQNR